MLRLELGELKLSGFDLSLTGFGDLELKDLLAERTGGLTDPDDAAARWGSLVFEGGRPRRSAPTTSLQADLNDVQVGC